MRRCVWFVLSLAACSTARSGEGVQTDLAGSGATTDFASMQTQDGSGTPPTTDAGVLTCGKGCYTVYAHSDTELYSIDLTTKALVDIGPFNAPKVMGQQDIMTDLAVAPDNTIYVISNTQLYTADPSTGHVTVVGAVTACGSQNVALTTTPDGNLYAGDFKGAFCEINLKTTPPTVTPIGMLGSNLALAGDLVAVDDGTMYGSAYDTTKNSTYNDNYLVIINPTTGVEMTNLGATGFPSLFGVAYALGEVFGFTHDGSGDVVTIDPKTGKGTLFGTFKDGGKGIAFAGAGVNSMVSPIIN